MEDRYLETHKTWNNVAQLYEDKFMELDIYDDTYKRFCDLLSKENATVLELGCGPGNITRHLLDCKPELKILATDVSVNMINFAKKNNPKIEIMLLDCRNLHAIDSKFDGIICGFTIPYLSKTDLSSLIKHCAHALNEGGVLYLSYVEGLYKNSGFISGSSGDRCYFYYYDFQDIKQLLDFNNMVIVDHSALQYKKEKNSNEVHSIVQARKAKDF